LRKAPNMDIKNKIEKLENREINIINIESQNNQMYYTYEYVDSPGYGGVAIVHLN
jgi:hypothetical protein